MRRSFVYVVLFAALAPAAGACLRSSDNRTPAPTGAVPATEGAPSGRLGTTVSPRGLPLGDLQISPDDRKAATGGATEAVTEGGGGPVLELEVEIADTLEASARGLMGVEHLSDGQGMVFLPGEPSSVAFWMKDTLIPLDVAFWDQKGRIFDIQQMQPCRVPEGQLAEAVCPRYSPSGSYAGALEVNLGLLERSGVHPGATVKLERR